MLDWVSKALPVMDEVASRADNLDSWCGRFWALNVGYDLIGKVQHSALITDLDRYLTILAIALPLSDKAHDETLSYLSTAIKASRSNRIPDSSLYESRKVTERRPALMMSLAQARQGI